MTKYDADLFAALAIIFDRPFRRGDSISYDQTTGSVESIGLKSTRIRSATGEQTGDGAEGKKASGLLMIEGVLYLWARNAGNSQLAWSSDHAQTWTWCDWRFETSFGCPSSSPIACLAIDLDSAVSSCTTVSIASALAVAPNAFATKTR